MSKKHSQRSENDKPPPGRKGGGAVTLEELSRKWYDKCEPKAATYEGPVDKAPIIDGLVEDMKRKQAKITVPPTWDILLYFMSKDSRSDFLAENFPTYKEMRIKYGKFWADLRLGVKVSLVGLESLVCWLCSRTGRVAASLFFGIAEQFLSLKTEWLKPLKMEAAETREEDK